MIHYKITLTIGKSKSHWLSVFEGQAAERDVFRGLDQRDHRQGDDYYQSKLYLRQRFKSKSVCVGAFSRNDTTGRSVLTFDSDIMMEYKPLRQYLQNWLLRGEGAKSASYKIYCQYFKNEGFAAMCKKFPKFRQLVKLYPSSTVEYFKEGEGIEE